MYIDGKAVIESLTKEDVTKIVMALGSGDPKNGSNGELIFQTICHNKPDPNNSYKLYYYHEPTEQYKGRLFHCYTGCSESFGIIELVMRANRVQGKTLTYYKALYWIAQITGHLITAQPDKQEEVHRIDFGWINRLNTIKHRKSKALPQLKAINENVLDCFSYDRSLLEGWIQEGISAETLGRFEIGFSVPHNAITIPHRDWKTNDLIGVRCRHVLEEDIEEYGKYTPMYIGGQVLKHSLGSSLFGLNVTKDHIRQIHKIMLCESEKGVLQAYTEFGENSFVCSVCGSNITQTQMKIMLQELAVEEVMICFDREYHESDSFLATSYYEKLVKKVAALVPFCRVYLILDKEERVPYKQSPLDTLKDGNEVLLSLMKEKILITMDDVNQVTKG